VAPEGILSTYNEDLIFLFTVIKLEIVLLTRSCDQAGSTSGVAFLLQLEKLVVLGDLLGSIDQLRCYNTDCSCNKKSDSKLTGCV